MHIKQVIALKRLFFSLVTIFIFSTSFSQRTSPDQKYQLIKGSNTIQTKNYYLLTLFQELPAVKELLSSDAALSVIAKDKMTKLGSSMKDCQRGDFSCYTDQMRLSENEIKTVSDRLTALYKPGNALDKMVREHLIPSGTYEMFGDMTPQQQLIKSWEQDAAGVNFVIGVYAEGKAAKYPLIDSSNMNVKSPGYTQFLFTATQTILDDCKKSSLFFLPSMMSALRFLELNERYNAADYEPMMSTVNKAAIDRVSKIDWKKYKYSVIVIPGAGPNDPKVALSAEGLLRCRIAAQRYFEGLAPFIMPSGGRVHPYKTIYSEAYEMKKYLMEYLKVPESAIIMDPHARHTTTNLRNAVRIIYRYGMPFDKPALSSTSRGQTNSIATTLAARCQQELKITPFRIGARLSDTEVEFYPLVSALNINPLEPLDP